MNTSDLSFMSILFKSNENRTIDGSSIFIFRRYDKFRRERPQHRIICKSKNATGPGVRRSKRPLLASRIRCKMFYGNLPEFGNKVKVVNKVQLCNMFTTW